MDSGARIDTQPLSQPALPDRPGVELRAPVEIADERRERDWLGTAWTAVFAAYAGAVLPLLGWAVAHGL